MNGSRENAESKFLYILDGVCFFVSSFVIWFLIPLILQISVGSSKEIIYLSKLCINAESSEIAASNASGEKEGKRQETESECHKDLNIGLYIQLNMLRFIL